MKKITLLLLIGFFMVSSMAISQTVDVTFRVDMQDQTVDPNGVHIAGSFQGWIPADNPLTSPVFGYIWETTIAINIGEAIEYKFTNGDDWSQPEPSSGPCFSGGNRSLTVPAFDTTLMAVCFGSCTPCVGGYPGR